MQIEGIIESRDALSLSYILPRPELFYNTGYKVLLNQEKNGFIGCVKVLYNGRTKLVYDISRFKSLNILMSELQHEGFLTILKNLIDVVIEVKNNGFMQCENIETSLDKIFIDSNNYKVFLIYLPVDTPSNKDSYVIFEGLLKNSIFEAIRRFPKLASPAVNALCDKLRDPVYSVESIRDSLNQNFGQQQAARQNAIPPPPQPYAWERHQDTGAYSAQPADAFQNSWQPQYANPPQYGMNVTQPVKKRRGLFSGQPKERRSPAVMFQPQCEGGSTQILDDLFYPGIMLTGVKTPVKADIVINKEEFVIGKKPDSVDGAVQFNNAISRTHCKIVFIKGKYFIIDLDSSNGTFVNGARVQPGKQVQINLGDMVRLANSDFIVKAV